MMSKTGKLARGVGISTVLVLAITACGGGASEGSANGSAAGSLAEMDELTLRYTTLLPKGSPSGEAIIAFAEKVAEKSGGKITVEPYFSGSLLPGDETLEGLGSGVAQMGTLIPSYFPQELPVNNWHLNMASLAPDSYPHGILVGSAAVMEMQASNDALREEWSGHGVKVLTGAQGDVGYNLLCTIPIDSLADAKGLRVRTGGGVWVAELEALGMTPVRMPMLETYQGLQRGVVDCVTATPQAMVSYGLWEVAPHFIPVAMSPTNGFIQGINLGTWNELPAEAQSILTDAAHTLWAVKWKGAMEKYATFATEGQKKHGVKFHEPASLDQVLAKHQNGVVNELVGSAPGVVTDPASFVDSYRGLLSEWQNQVKSTVEAAERPRDSQSIRESFISAPSVDYSKYDELTESVLFGVGR